MRAPTKKTLQNMTRVEIQQLCKDYGVRANLKTEVLIDLLLDASKPLPPKPTPSAPRARTASIATRVSSRRSSGRSRQLSKASVIIHDSEHEPEEDQDAAQPEETKQLFEEKDVNEAETTEPAASESEVTPASLPLARTRKVKEQTRLGKGRPVIAGGTGARAITKSLSIPKGMKRGRSSRSVIPVEETIEEEEPEGSNVTPPPPTEPTFSMQEVVSDTGGSLASLEAIDRRVAAALRPLHEQMSSLKSEVERLKTQAHEVPRLQSKVKDLTTEIEGLRNNHTAKILALESEMSKLREESSRKLSAAGPSAAPGTPSRPTSGKYGSLAKGAGGSGPSALATAKTVSNGKAPTASGSGTPPAQAASQPAHPGYAATITGKRRRGSDTSDITGVIEEGEQDEYTEGELETRVIRPTKKRAKLDDNESSSQDAVGAASGSSQAQDQLQENETVAGLRAPSFTVYSGPDEPGMYDYDDPPPPTNHLPDFFTGSPDQGNNNHGHTHTAHASENQNPFGFNFLPMSSTPMHTMFPMAMPNFPYPEAPTSPSPAGERSFQPFSNSPTRPRPNFSHGRPSSRREGDGTVNPAALSEQQTFGVGPSMGVGRVGETTATANAGASKRTMYGTELEGDTRFGDFGMEGVATGFWAGGRF